MRLIIKGSLYILLIYLIERYRWRSVFPCTRFVDQALHILFSSASRAHPSQEGLWGTEGSCSGEASLPGLPIKCEER